MVWEVAQYSLWAVMLYVRYSTWIFHLTSLQSLNLFGVQFA